MGAILKHEHGNVYTIRLTGLLKKSELDTMQAAAATMLDADPNLSIKLMVVVANFEGWERGANWDDMTFYTKYGDKITRMAIVADPKLQPSLKMFSGAGFRSAPVKFFPPNQLEDARIWIAE